MKKITLLGIAYDAASSYMRGSSYAPARIREVIRSGVSNMFTEKGVNLDDLDMTDAGDLQPEKYEDIRDEIAKRVNDDSLLLALGGDHSITFPVLQVLQKRYGDISILHIDAHPDLYHSYEGNPFSHACPFARIMEEGLAVRLVQVGIRTLNDHQREQSEKFGTEIIEMKDFSLKKLPSFTGNIYISIDLDGLDPAFAPGVSHQEPGGLTPRDVISMIHRIKGNLIGADIVEYNPLNDSNGITAALSAKLVKELVGRMAG